MTEMHNRCPRTIQVMTKALNQYKINNLMSNSKNFQPPFYSQYPGTNDVMRSVGQRHIAKMVSGWGAMRGFPQLLPIWDKIQEVSHCENVG